MHLCDAVVTVMGTTCIGVLIFIMAIRVTYPGGPFHQAEQ